MFDAHAECHQHVEASHARSPRPAHDLDLRNVLAHHSEAFNTAAPTMIAVPCWSSNTESSRSRSFFSMKHSSALMSSRFMPPKARAH
jgi:hypothetical protein